MSFEDVTLELVDSFEKAESFMRWLGERREVMAFDLETGGLEFWKQPIRLAQFGDAMKGWAIPWDRWAGLVDEAMGRYDGALVAHNTQFDVKFLEANGVRVPRHQLHDTRAMAHILEPHNLTGLKPLAVRHVHPIARFGEEQLKDAMKKQKWGWKDLPVDFEPYWVYGALDPVLTARLYEKFAPQIEADEGYKHAYDLEVAVSLVLMDMERRGARVDLGYCDRKKHELMAYADQVREWIKNEYGLEKPTSTVQLRRTLEGLGYGSEDKPWPLRTETCEQKHSDSCFCPALSEEALLQIDEPLAQAVLNMRKSDKIVASYMDNLLEMADSSGVVHPSINSLGARTGRMSVSNPALQTLPRGAIVRNAFIPREGNLMGLIDYDQMELRVMAHYAGDPTMIEAIRRGEDLHTYTARLAYNDPDMEKSDPRRQLAKNAGFAKIYCAGVSTFAKTAGVSYEEARDFLDRYDRTYPYVGNFQKELSGVAQQRYREEGEAYIRDWSGRRHPLEKNKIYKGVNYLIQGGCAMLLKKKIVDLDAAGLGDYLILPVHDEMVFDVPENEAEEVVNEAAKIMEEHELFDVPLTVGPKIVSRWGEAYE